MGPFVLLKSFFAVVKLFAIFECALEKHGFFGLLNKKDKRLCMSFMFLI